MSLKWYMSLKYMSSHCIQKEFYVIKKIIKCQENTYLFLQAASLSPPLFFFLGAERTN